MDHSNVKLIYLYFRHLTDQSMATTHNHMFLVLDFEQYKIMYIA